MTTTTETPEGEARTLPRRQQRYREKVIAALTSEFEYPNPMMVPRLEKIVINMGVGQAVENKNRMDAAVKDLTAICGQKPLIRKARVAVSGFRLRIGYAIGVAVTLRGNRMWEFLDRLISLAIPRIRDFRGLPKKFDGHGNYTFGVTEQLIFPEMDYDKIDRTRGMDITIVTSANTDEEGRALLDAFKFPFRQEVK